VLSRARKAYYLKSFETRFEEVLLPAIPRIKKIAFFVATTMLPDLIGFKLVRVRTLWQYNNNGSARFITILVGGEKQ
jgi:hypothetical protein